MNAGRSVPALLVGALVIVLGACSSGATPAGSAAASASTGAASAAPSAGDPATDQLAHILARGTLQAYTTDEYPPQSVLLADAPRPADTKCQPNQLTISQVEGYDNEATKIVADGLGLEVCLVVPSWTEVTAGNWADRWDIAYGSGSINADRMTRLYMTQPYYATPNSYFVRQDSAFKVPADLDGHQIGVCASCSQEAYLKGTLEIPGVDVGKPKVAGPVLVSYETEPPGLAEVAAGKIDAFLCADPVGQAAIVGGLKLRRLDEVAFTYYPTGFVDRSSGYDARAFLDRVDSIIRAALQDGRLAAASQRWFGTDYATPALAFDLASIGQTVP